jgi:site-specific recombinase XerD
MKRYRAEAGLPEHLRHLHALKHSICTHLIAKGAGIFEVRDWVGHRSLASTAIYAEFRNKQRDEVSARIYAMDTDRIIADLRLQRPNSAAAWV